MDLQAIEQSALQELESTKSLPEIEAVYSRYLGRKDGSLTQILRNLGTLPPEEKKTIGQAANKLRILLEERISTKQKSLQETNLISKLGEEKIDVTLPGTPFQHGITHPIIQTIQEISQIFRLLGFEVAAGPDIENDFENFTALNIPANHPSRDLHDTFYVDVKDPSNPSLPLLLRTHTSPVQVRLMKSVQPPIRMIAPGRVYRHEAVDATHGAIFHQIEGLAVDRKISFADLKATLTGFARKFFGEDMKVRFRPGYFPFVEPGAEMDLQCFLCKGAKVLSDGSRCSLCKASGWIEMLGAGMVHPNVFRAVGYDPEKWTGFAFGMGIERILMTRAGIRDIRHFLESDLRFLEQFS